MKQLASRSAVLFVVLSVLLAFVSSSEARGAGRRPAVKPRPQTPYIAIGKVDTTAMTITTESKNSASSVSKSYKLLPTTKVTISGNPGTLADLKSGMQVRIGAGMDANIATEISASAPPPEVK